MRFKLRLRATRWYRAMYVIDSKTGRIQAYWTDRDFSWYWQAIEYKDHLNMLLAKGIQVANVWEQPRRNRR